MPRDSLGTRAFAAMLLATAIPLPAAAQAQLGGGISAGSLWTDNASPASSTPGAKPAPEVVSVVRPSVAGGLALEGFVASIDYLGHAWHHQSRREDDRILHWMRARAAFVWWERIDLHVAGELEPVAVDRGLPTHSPANLVQRTSTIGVFAIRPDLSEHVQPGLAYRVDRNDYVDGPDGAPGWIAHGPELSVRMKPGAFALTGVGRYLERRQDGAPAPVHSLEGTVGIVLQPWGAFWLEARGGAVQTTVEPGPKRSDWTADATARRVGEYVSFELGGRRALAFDLDGTVATAQGMSARADLTPPASWALWVAAETGALTFAEPAHHPRNREYRSARIGGRVFLSKLSVEVIGYRFESRLYDQPFTSNSISVELGVRFR